MTNFAAWLALACSGLAFRLYAPPFNWVWLQLFAWVPAFVVISQLRGRRAFLAGWLVGTLTIASGYYWVAATVERFSSLPGGVAAAVGVAFAAAHGLYLGLFAWGFEPIRRAAGPAWPLALAICFTALEFATPQLFPHYQGSMWYQQAWFFGLTAFTGTSGVTLLVIFCNAVATQAVLSWRGLPQPGGRRSLAWNGAVLVAGVAIAVALSAVRLARIDALESQADSLRVALVQPNHDVPTRRSMRRGSPEAFARDLVAMSRAALQDDPGIEIFVWPEGAISAAPDADRNRALREFVRETGLEVWTGANVPAHTEAGERRVHNSAYRVYGDGELDVRYDKNRLVPFGEYMPFADVFPALSEIRGPGNFVRGDGLPIYDSQRARFAFLICYEAIQADYVREAVRQGPDLLVNLTFDAWYGDTSEPHTHLMLAAAQAAQYGLPLLRATTTGISAVVDARGRIVARTGVFTREVLVADVLLVRQPTFYTRAGDWLPWSCVLLSVFWLVRSRRVPAVD